MREISSMQFESINYANYAIAYKQPNISFILQRYFLRPFNIRNPPPFPGQDNWSLPLDDIRYKIFKVYMQRKMQILTISIFIIIIQKICFITKFLTSEHQVCFRWWYKRWHAVSDLIKSIQDMTSISEYFCLLQHEFNLHLATYMYKDVLEWKL